MATKRKSSTRKQGKSTRGAAAGKRSAARTKSAARGKRPEATGTPRSKARAAGNGRRISATLLPEFDQEMATTRRLLERVPAEKGTWKPHQKSFSLGHLAQLVSWMPGWITNALQETALDLAAAGGYSDQTTEQLLGIFDRNVREARAAIAEARDADYDVSWSLKHGAQVIMTMPRAIVVRQNINHLVHHRGQLSVYLRLIDVPLPSIYGPTADERVPGF